MVVPKPAQALRVLGVRVSVEDLYSVNPDAAGVLQMLMNQLVAVAPQSRVRDQSDGTHLAQHRLKFLDLKRLDAHKRRRVVAQIAIEGLLLGLNNSLLQKVICNHWADVALGGEGRDVDVEKPRKFLEADVQFESISHALDERFSSDYSVFARLKHQLLETRKKLKLLCTG